MKTKKMMALVATGFALAMISGASAETVVVNGEVIKDAIVVRNGIIVMNGTPESVDLVHPRLLRSYVRDKTVVVYGKSVPANLVPHGYVMNDRGYLFYDFPKIGASRWTNASPIDRFWHTGFWEGKPPRRYHPKRIILVPSQYNPAALPVTQELDEKNHPTQQ